MVKNIYYHLWKKYFFGIVSKPHLLCLYIKNINISWAGYAETNSSIDGKLRILTNEGYEDLSDISTENQIYNYNITYNFTNYLNSTNYLRLQAWVFINNSSDSLKLWTDWIRVTVVT